MKNFLEALAEAFGALCFIILIIGIIGISTVGRIYMFEDEVKSLQKQYAEISSIEGEIYKIENYTGPDKIVDKKGNITITLTISTDRTKIYFKDGRSKEFIGMPKKPIEIGKYYKITYHKYNILGQITEVEPECLKCSQSELEKS